MKNNCFFFHYMVCVPQPLPRLPRVNRTVVRSYMDCATTYDTHNRVFYIYYLGIFNGRPFYHYGETNDMDATEFHLKSRLPFYHLVTYVPVETQYHALSRFHELVINERVTLPVHSLEHMDTFTTSLQDIESILHQVDQIYRVNVDEWI